MVVVGLDRHRSPLELLERVAVGEDRLGKTLAELGDCVPASEVVVVSTCLRTELYAVVDRFHEGVEAMHGWLAARAGVAVEDLSDHLTVLFDDAVALHLFEVAAGLHSAVVGESEVLGQVRRAAEVAEAERAAGPVLSGLFRRAVQVGRRVRNDTAIARGTTSLSQVALSLAAEQLGGSLAGRRVVVLGAGEMGEGLVRGLAERHGAGEVVVVNRTRRRAEELSGAVGGRAAGLEEVREALPGADVVLVSTGAPEPVLDAGVLGPALAGRTAASPVVVVDMSVPRNVEPRVKELAGVALFDMDDLTVHAARALEGRRGEIVKAQAVVAEEVDRYRVDGRARGVAPVVASLRAKVEQLRQAELDRHRSRLAGLDEAQRAEVEAVVRDVLAKVLHQPTVALKEAAGTPRGERLVEALRALFDL
ncbi:MAG: glutamyl-tRNA reductase [Acidobacteriota bacterium]|nr:glutamyl-tRNA reductase [Acidobacteriota bacterium]